MKIRTITIFIFAIIFYGVNVFAMPDSAEISIGRQADARLRAKYSVYENPDMQKYIEHVALKIVSVSDRQDMVYHFAVLNTHKINSMAVLGGYVYITKGMLLALQSEAQLAAVLSDEIMHIARRHGIKEIENNMKRAPHKQEAILRAGIIAQCFAEFGYRKKVQTDSDIRTAEYLLRAGYNPEALGEMLNIIQIKEKNSPKLIKYYLQNHYKTTKRIDAIRLMCNNLKAQDQNRYNSVVENNFPERYQKNVLDILAVEGV